MNVQAAIRRTEVWYLLSRAGTSVPLVDQKIVSNEFPFAARALFSAFNACFTAGTSQEFNEVTLSSETTSEVKLGMDIAILPFPALSLLGLLKDWENACSRHGEIEANQALMASLERDCLELDAQLKSWPANDPGRPDRQREIDGKRVLCQQLTARNHALRALAPAIEGRAATVGSGVTPVVVALNHGVSSALRLDAHAAIDTAKVADAAAAHELSDVAASSVSGLAIGLVNSACHLIRAFPEVDRAMAQLDGLQAAEHRLATAVEACLSRVQGCAVSREILANVVASMIPVIGNTRRQARIVAVNGFFRTLQGASGLALKSAGIAAAVLGPAAPFAAGVGIAGMVMGAGWLTWQAARLWWAQTLRVEASKIESQLKNDVAIAKKSLESGALAPPISAAMAPWLKLIEACREDGAQGPWASFLRQAGISESVIGACLSQGQAAIDLVVPLFSAFRESMSTAMPELTQERIDALKKRKDPRDVLNGFILEVENPDRPAKPTGNTTPKATLLKNQGNALTLEEVRHRVSAFKAGTVGDLSGHEGHAAKLLAQFFVDAKDRPQEMRQLEKDLLTRVKLFIDLTQNSDERAIACLSGRYPGLRGKAKFGNRVVKETAEAYLRSKYAGPAFEEKLALLQHLAKKDALVRRSTFMEWAKTYKTWQPTEAATEMAKWLSQPRHVPGAGLVVQVLEKQRGASASEHEAVVGWLKAHCPGLDGSTHSLGVALKALDACNAKALLDSAAQLPHVDARHMAMGKASGRAKADELNLRAVRNALLLRRGLAPRGAPAMDPVQALKALQVRHPRVAQAVLEALMGQRFEVPDLASDVAEQVRAIRLAYGDQFFEGEAAGDTVFFIPRTPGLKEDKALASLVKSLGSKDAPSSGQRGKQWPSSLITAATLSLMHQKTGPGFTAAQKRRAMADQLQRNLDSLRQSTPALFSPRWMPGSYVGTAVEHAVRSQHLRAMFPTETYDKADEAKCQDIDDTVTMLDAWRRKTPGGREVLRAIALGGTIRSMAAMHWLLDRPTKLSERHQQQIRDVAHWSLAHKKGSSKPFLNEVARMHATVVHASMDDFLGAKPVVGTTPPLKKDRSEADPSLKEIEGFVHKSRSTSAMSFWLGERGSADVSVLEMKKPLGLEGIEGLLFHRISRKLSAPRGDLPMRREAVEGVPLAG